MAAIGHPLWGLRVQAPLGAVRIGTETLALIEFCNFAEFVFVETEIPDIKVFGNT